MRQPPSYEQAYLILQESQDFDLNILPDYSGRGMYGNTCVAITGRGSQGSVFTAIGRLIERSELPVHADEWFQRQDNMGLGWVIY